MPRSFGIVTLPAVGVARLAQPAGSTPPPTGNQDTLQCPPPSPAGLTLREAWWVVVDISDYDGDCGGSRQATQLSCHVCCTDHHLVAVLCLTVQVCHGCPDHTWKPAGQLSTGRSQSHRQGEAGRGQRRSLWTRSRPNTISWISLFTWGRCSSISPTFVALPWTHSGMPTESHLAVRHSNCISPVHSRRDCHLP